MQNGEIAIGEKGHTAPKVQSSVPRRATLTSGSVAGPWRIWQERGASMITDIGVGDGRGGRKHVAARHGGGGGACGGATIERECRRGTPIIGLGTQTLAERRQE